MFAACFGRTATHDFREGPLLSSERHSVDATLGTASRDVKPGCVFCDVRTEKGFRVVAENEELIAFQDRSPAADHHYLVIPRVHIANVKTLSQRDIPLLERMETFGVDLLTSHGIPPSQQRLGYHIPPFNSVQHIHLHSLSLHLRSSWREFKYRPTSLRNSPGKRWGWFVATNDVQEILAAGQQVKVRSVALQPANRFTSA